MKINIYSHNNDSYPKCFYHLYDAPAAVLCAGAIREDIPLLAVVGSRRMTPYGKRVVDTMVPELVARGVGTVSGLAIGVDAAAHRATLDANGYTVAVVPSQLPNVYPRTHKALADKILTSGGGLICEQTAQRRLFKSDFLARNRLIAALADAVLVIEAARRSGTLATVRFALDIGKPVMAVPGNVFHNNSLGTHNLLKQGAALIDSSQDILEEMSIESSSIQKERPPANTPEEEHIISLLSAEDLSRNQLIHRSSIKASELNTHLSYLELKGVVRALGSDRYGLR